MTVNRILGLPTVRQPLLPLPRWTPCWHFLALSAMHMGIVAAPPRPAVLEDLPPVLPWLLLVRWVLLIARLLPLFLKMPPTINFL